MVRAKYSVFEALDPLGSGISDHGYSGLRKRGSMHGSYARSMPGFSVHNWKMHAWSLKVEKQWLKASMVQSH